MGFPSVSAVKNAPAMQEMWVPGSERFPGEGHGHCNILA